jgi:threonine/homoserine/homoserine lactone efflux protein
VYSQPKNYDLFLAFLPQFVVSGNGSVIAQFYQLGALMVCVTLVVFGAVAIAAGALGTWIKGSIKTQIWLTRISRIVFLSLAVKLATAKNSFAVAVGISLKPSLSLQNYQLKTYPKLPTC